MHREAGTSAPPATELRGWGGDHQPFALPDSSSNQPQSFTVTLEEKQQPVWLCYTLSKPPTVMGILSLQQAALLGRYLLCLFPEELWADETKLDHVLLLLYF